MNRSNIKLIAFTVMALAAGATTAYILTPKRNPAYEDLIESQLKYERRIVEELRAKAKNAEARDRLWQSIEKSYADSLKRSRAETRKFIKLYEGFNKVNAPDYTEPELDTLISAIIR